jgi:eukaryotic-like serine/threonine-protein kinase
MRDSASGCLALETVEGFIRGSLHADAADRIEEHLDGCEDCRALVAELARGGGAAAGTVQRGRAAPPQALGVAPTAFALAGPDRSAEQALLGSTLADTYRLVRVIGRGGMGLIWEAHHVRLKGKRYALKLLGAQFARDQGVLARFRREAEIASQLGNEHIVEVHDFNTASGQAYMVMEMLEGEDLAGRIKGRGALPIEDAKHIFDQVASALDAAHRAHIVHRDLKPPNVFLCRRGGRDDYVKVLDFGLSKVLDSMTVVTRDYTLLGTPYYMSPEQAEGRIKEIDQRADVFALGAIFWEMLTGQMAFGGSTFAEVLEKVRLVDPPDVHLLRREVPPGVSLALRRALAKDRHARTPAVAALAGELTAALRGSGPGPASSPPQPWQSPSGPVPAVAPVGAQADGMLWSPSPDVMPVPPAWHQPAPPVHAAHASAPMKTVLVAKGSVHIPPRRKSGPIIALVITLIASALATAGVWFALTQSEQTEEETVPSPEPAEFAKAAPAPAEPTAPEPAPAAAEQVALSFTVEPRGVSADIYVDGERVIDGQIKLERSDKPVSITARAKGYPSFRTQVAPKSDRTIAIVFRRKSRPKARSKAPAAPAAPRATQPPAAPQPQPGTQPGYPTQPAPAQPTQPGYPTQPAPAQPTQPGYPTQPAPQPARPAQPAPQPAQPAPQPAQPVQPAPQPTHPGAQQPAPQPQPPQAQPQPQPQEKPSKKKKSKRGSGTVFDQ